ncbi:phenylacetaldehyde reductase-like [Impatiens glandulifera]|uniref:phenylacetaldehyde reductase-like n=1 Tax=Impatiens glandulifera TaxID=253017 RepID=UPI001FB13F9F|nr:phenylacetaldehyde reductase-like [Impatiens glandulifera]
MSGEGKTVCVTGASGFIASWLVKHLLRRGYTVNATVRDLSDPLKTKHLVELDGAKERLKLFKANLTEDCSFDEAIEGCHGVFHVASPCTFTTKKDPYAEIVEPAVKGTINVLNSCAKTPSVRRVILTSSITAVSFTTRRSSEGVLDETWFSDPEHCKKNKLWYQLSKTLAEEAAWKFVKEKGIDMVVINSSAVIGSMFNSSLNLTCVIVLNLMNGLQLYKDLIGWINVKDVADAHIQAFEISSANGRYCLSERELRLSDVANELVKLYPSFITRLPQKWEEDDEFSVPYPVSKEKAKTLGINFIPFEVSLKETVESLKEMGLVSF